MDQTRVTNIESFLEKTSARVTVHYPTETRGSSSSAEEKQPEGQVCLRDIWEAYENWSTYGVDIPLWVENADSKFIQYYTPSLSAIQIFTKANQYLDGSSSRVLAVGSNGGGERGTVDCSFRHRYLDVDQLGHLYFQYNETLKPFERAPLTFMMAELAEKHRGLFSLKSSDLSPYSWMSIAWYPIYQIPAMKNWKEVSACFLTYHGLTPSIPETLPKDDKVNGAGPSNTKAVLHAFGALTYRGSSVVWTEPGTSELERIDKYEESAASWLETLEFNHNDFNFFRSRRRFGPSFPPRRKVETPYA